MEANRGGVLSSSQLGVLSPARVKKYRETLRRISREVGPFEGVTKPSLKACIENVNASGFTDWTATHTVTVSPPRQ